MRRRAFIAGAGATAVAWPFATLAQAQQRRARLAFLAYETKEATADWLAALREGLAALGYAEGKSLEIDERYADADVSRFPALAKDLLQRHPDVIVADTPPAAVAANRAAPELPVVLPIFTDNLIPKLAAGYEHPGGSVTGLATFVEQMGGKFLELVLDAIPGARAVGLLVNPSSPTADIYRQQTSSAAQSRNVAFVPTEATTLDEMRAAFEQLAAAKAQAVIVHADALFIRERRMLGELSLRSRLPVFTDNELMFEAGALTYSGVDVTENFRRAATYVDKILKGAKPGDLPIEFPTRIRLFVNLKVAKALGLTIPPTLIARADEVIE